MVKQIGDKGCKILGIVEADKMEEDQTKKLFCKKSLRRTRFVLQSTLSCRNKVKEMSTEHPSCFPALRPVPPMSKLNIGIVNEYIF